MNLSITHWSHISDVSQEGTYKKKKKKKKRNMAMLFHKAIVWQKPKCAQLSLFTPNVVNQPRHVWCPTCPSILLYWSYEASVGSNGSLSHPNLFIIICIQFSSNVTQIVNIQIVRLALIYKNEQNFIMQLNTITSWTTKISLIFLSTLLNVKDRMAPESWRLCGNKFV